MNRLVKEIWIQFILSIHQTHNVYAAPFCRRNFYDASCFLPGIWNISLPDTFYGLNGNIESNGNRAVFI
jgi:hypothetical protein